MKIKRVKCNKQFALLQWYDFSNTAKTFKNNILQHYNVDVRNLKSKSEQHVLFMEIVLMLNRHAMMMPCYNLDIARPPFCISNLVICF